MTPEQIRYETYNEIINLTINEVSRYNHMAANLSMEYRDAKDCLRKSEALIAFAKLLQTKRDKLC